MYRKKTCVRPRSQEPTLEQLVGNPFVFGDDVVGLKLNFVTMEIELKLKWFGEDRKAVDVGRTSFQ